MWPLAVGVNLAMLDAAEPAEALISRADLRQPVSVYEEVMFDRSTAISEQCTRGFAEMFYSEGLQAILGDVDAHPQVLGLLLSLRLQSRCFADQLRPHIFTTRSKPAMFDVVHQPA
jgi:hypothetical protein